MDLLQLQVAIEQTLNNIQSQSPNAIEHLVQILQWIQSGAAGIWGVSTLVSKYPLLIEATNKLLILLQSGSTITEIATILAQWAAPLGAIADALIQLLYLIGGALVLL
jgi:hypothetical protein